MELIIITFIVIAIKLFALMLSLDYVISRVGQLTLKKPYVISHLLLVKVTLNHSINLVKFIIYWILQVIYIEQFIILNLQQIKVI